MNELFFLIIPNITATLIIRKLHLQPSIINLPRCKKNATIIYRTPSSEKEQSSWKIEWFSIWRPCAAKNEDLKIKLFIHGFVDLSQASPPRSPSSFCRLFLACDQILLKYRGERVQEFVSRTAPHVPRTSTTGAGLPSYQ